MKYNCIYQCTLNGQEIAQPVFKNQYLLSDDTSDHMYGELEIDLTGDCCYNCDFIVEDRKKVAEVSNLKDLISFCEKHKIHLSPRVYSPLDKNHLYLGDFETALDSNLETVSKTLESVSAEKKKGLDLLETIKNVDVDAKSVSSEVKPTKSHSEVK